MNAPESATPTVPYGHLEPMFVHFDDLDSMAMVHNTRYAVFVERALSMFWESNGYGYPEGRLSHPDASVGVAEFSIVYRTPVRGTCTILVHLVVERVGESSVVYRFRVLDAEARTVHAEGRRVHIHLDPKTFRPAPWAEETRAIYKTLQEPGT